MLADTFPVEALTDRHAPRVAVARIASRQPTSILSILQQA